MSDTTLAVEIACRCRSAAEIGEGLEHALRAVEAGLSVAAKDDFRWFVGRLLGCVPLLLYARALTSIRVRLGSEVVGIRPDYESETCDEGSLEILGQLVEKAPSFTIEVDVTDSELALAADLVDEERAAGSMRIVEVNP